MSTATAAIRNTRLDFRLAADHKALIEQASQVQGQTVSDFAVSTLVRAALLTIEQASATRLSQRDGKVFLAMLDRSAKPNAALKRAARRYTAARA